MIRAVIALLFLGVGSVRAAEDYFPLAKGHTWEYAGKVNDAKVNVTATITAVKVENGKTTATRALALKMGDEIKESEEELTVDAAGVQGNVIFDVKSEPRLTLLKFPLKPRDTWSQKATINKGEFLVMSTVKDATEVKVPAGTYTAIPIETGLLFDGEAVGITTWYADGVGMVKLKMVYGANTFDFELKKFTRGK